MNYQNIQFRLSVADLPQLPNDGGLEVAFAGRSNAGKSSTLNRLTQRKDLARTSKTPGRTQLINIFDLADGEQRLVDLPGYGFANVHISVRQYWGRLIGQYLEQRESLAGVVIVADVRRGLTDLDRQLLGWCQERDRAVHLLLNKADKFKRGQQMKALHPVEKELREQYPDYTCQLFSAQSGAGLDKLRAKLDEWLDLSQLPERADPDENDVNDESRYENKIITDLREQN